MPKGRRARTDAQVLEHIQKNIELRQGERPELGPCWIWQMYCNPDGYAQMTYQGKDNMYVARVIKKLYGEEVPPGMVTRHRCRNQRDCVNPDHLQVGTHKENAEDRERDGNTARGTKNGSNKLKEVQVLDIYSRLQVGERVAVLAAEYGVDGGTIREIRNKRSWKWLIKEIDATFASLIGAPQN